MAVSPVNTSRVSFNSRALAMLESVRATALGIRSFHADRVLSELRSGQGVEITDGEEDFPVIAKDGSTFDVNLDGAVAVGDVLDAINAAATEAGVAASASMAGVGNGIRLVDQTNGGGAPGDLSAGVEATAAPCGAGALGTPTWPGAGSPFHNSLPDKGLGVFDRPCGTSSRNAGPWWHVICSGKPVTRTPEHGFELRVMRREATTTRQATSKRPVRRARVRLADRLLPTVVRIRRGVVGTHGPPAADHAGDPWRALVPLGSGR
ncbi:MAG: hypothetical protein IH988_07860 [Planctomycetes bacterium]|nr:hypothetical protein [Planctomycetota bacterium]